MGLEARSYYEQRCNRREEVTFKEFQFSFTWSNELYPKKKGSVVCSFRAKNYENALKQAKKFAKEKGWELKGEIT